MFQAMAESWGARPTPMNFNELYLALKRGVVDGQENPLPTIKSGKFTEVQKYLVLSGYTAMTLRLVVVNDAAWQKIAAADRKSRGRCAEGANGAGRQPDHRAGETLVDEFKAAGVTVLQPDVGVAQRPRWPPCRRSFSEVGQGHLRIHRAT